MELEESLQRNIMQAIQDLEKTFQGNLASKGGVSSLSISNFDARFVQEDRDRLAQKCHESERQIGMLHEEKQLMQQEMARLQSIVDMLENPRGSALIGDDGASLGPAQPGSTRYNEMRRQLESLKDELMQAEAQRDDFKIKSFQLENDVALLKSKYDEHNVRQHLHSHTTTISHFFPFSSKHNPNWLSWEMNWIYCEKQTTNWKPAKP